MCRCRYPHPWALLGVLLWAASVSSAPQDQKDGDDSLPAGALRRLGTATPVPPQPQTDEPEVRGVEQVRLWRDGKHVTIVTAEGKVQVWELASGKLLHQPEDYWDVYLSPDGKVVAQVGGDNTILLEAADTGEVIRPFREPLPAAPSFLTFSADGKTLIAGHSRPERFSVWDAETGKRLYSTKCQGFSVRSATVSPDGKVLVLGGAEGALQIWDSTAWKQRYQRDGDREVRDLAFSPDGRLLASVSDDCCVWLWDTKTYQPVRRLRWRGPQGSFAVFSPDGKLLACNVGREVVLWEVATGKVWRTFAGHQGAVTSAVFTADGKRLLTGSKDGSVLVWDVTAPPPVPSAVSVRKDRAGDPLPGGVRARLGSARLFVQDGPPLGGVDERCLAFSADGKRLFAGLSRPQGGFGQEDSNAAQVTLDLHPEDGPAGVRVLDVPSGQESVRLEDAPDGVDCLALSPDGKTLVALAGPILHLWDAGTGKQRKMTHVGILHARMLTFSPDGRLLATGAEHVELLDAVTGRPVRQLRGRRPKPAALAFSRDGKQLLSCSGPTSGRQDKGKEVVEPAELVVWDVATGKIVRRAALSADHELGSFCFSPDGALLAASHGGQKVRLWDTANGRELPSIPVEVSALAFSPDGKRLAVGGSSLRLWDLGARKEARSFKPAEKLIWQVLFSPDGKLLATRGQTHLHFWDADRGREIVPHEGHNGAIAAIACSADGKLVLSGGADHSLCLWDAPAGKLLRRLEGHEAEVTTLALSPDGKRAASQDVDGRAIFWDTVTGRRLRTLKLAGPPALVLGGWQTSFQKAAFSADGAVLLLADAAGVVRRWQVSSWKELHRLQGDEAALPPALSPDGKLLAFSVNYPSQGSQVRLREADTGSEKWRTEYGHTGTTLAATRIEAMTFSPDGGYLAIGGVVYQTAGLGGIEGARLTLHESATGKEVLALAPPFLPAVVGFSADGKLLAAATGGGSFAWMVAGIGAAVPPCLWDVRSGEPVGVLAGHRGLVTDLAFSADGRTLFTGSTDGTILVWDVGRLPLRRPRRPHELSAQRLRRAWDDLAGADAERAFRTIADLSAVPAKTLPFLQARLRPAQAEDAHVVARLIADLDSEAFAVREKAARQLTEKIDQAEPALRRALQDQPSLETRQRLEGILRHVRTSPEQRRAWRVCVLLDWLDTPEADRLLGTLADGAADARLTREARAALERRRRRQACDGGAGTPRRE